MRYLSLCALVAVVSAEEWRAQDYPNPRVGNGYKQCKMRASSNVCDPDEILTESERYRLHNDLIQLAQRTKSASETNYCNQKGIEAVLAVTQFGSEKLAQDLSKLWNLDNQCKKAVVFVLSAEDRKLYYSGEENTGLSPANFVAIVSGQEMQLAEGKFTSALTNIFKQIGGKQNEQSVTGSDSTSGDSKQGKGCSNISLSLPLFALSLIILMHKLL